MTPPAEDTPNEQPANSPETAEAPSNSFDGEAAPSEPAGTSLDEDTSFSTGPGRNDVTIDLEELDRNFDEASDEITDLESRYEIGEMLGRGGMGTVRRAFDRRLGRDVAIKRISHKRKANRIAIRRFMTEARSLALLNHLNIVQVHDYGEAIDGPYIVMELIEGPTLGAVLLEGRLYIQTAVEVIDQLCRALVVTHSQGVIHRDIKPSNVLMTHEGVPKLADFGLARQETVAEGGTQTGAVLGTLDYISPEQRVDASRVDSRSDLWSLAATFYHMLVGDVPRVIRPDRLPDRLVPVLMKALEEDPDARYQTAGELRDAILQAMASRSRTTESGLPVGQCPACLHVSDEEIKFCEECGESLLVPCVSCQAETKPWTTFCGECGTNVAEFLNTRWDELRQQQQQVRTWHGEFRYPEALELLNKLVTEEHPRFVSIREWGQARLPLLQQEYTELKESRDTAFNEATMSFGRRDYEDVIRLLEPIPEAVLGEEAEQLLGEAQDRQQRVVECYSTIRNSVRKNYEEGLLELVEEYLALKPGDRRVMPLWDQLRRRKTHQRLRELRSEIRQRVSDNQYDGLLPLVEECLELRPDDSRMNRLAETLRREALADAKRRMRRLVGVGGGVVVLLILLPGLYGWNTWQRVAARSAIIEKEIAAETERRIAAVKRKLLVAAKEQAERRKQFAAKQEAERRQFAAKQEAERRISKSVQTLKGHSGPVTSVSFSPDGKRIVSGSLD